MLQRNKDILSENTFNNSYPIKAVLSLSDKNLLFSDQEGLKILDTLTFQTKIIYDLAKENRSISILILKNQSQFYSYGDGVITLWNLNPIKILYQQFELATQLVVSIHGNLISRFASGFIGYNKVFVWESNLSCYQILGEKYGDAYHKDLCVSAVATLSDNRLATLSYHRGIGYGYALKIWNLNTMESVTHVNTPLQHNQLLFRDVGSEAHLVALPNQSLVVGNINIEWSGLLQCSIVNRHTTVLYNSHNREMHTIPTQTTSLTACDHFFYTTVVDDGGSNQKRIDQIKVWNAKHPKKNITKLNVTIEFKEHCAENPLRLFAHTDGRLGFFSNTSLCLIELRCKYEYLKALIVSLDKIFEEVYVEKKLPRLGSDMQNYIYSFVCHTDLFFKPKRQSLDLEENFDNTFTL